MLADNRLLNKRLKYAIIPVTRDGYLRPIACESFSSVDDGITNPPVVPKSLIIAGANTFDKSAMVAGAMRISLSASVRY